MKTPDNLSLRSIFIVGITLLALALGGSTELWAQAVIVLLAAILILIFPPRLALGAVPILSSLLFLALAFSAFLPVSFGPLPEWRRHLSIDLHVPLGDFRTPQPWLTLQWCGLVIFGIVWIYYLFAQEWNRTEKAMVIRLLVFGIILLAAVSAVAYLTGYRIPGWTEEQNRGWFPNRNQTADVLALAGILNYAIAFKLLEKKNWTGLLWLAGLAVICVALVISYSRAGILIFFSGVAFWHLGSLFRPKEAKSVAIGLSSILLLLSLFLLFGGSTLERFIYTSPFDHPPTVEYRALIQEDAFRVSLHTPLLGIGLGNFEPVFTSMRQVSADQNRTIHPESDWLWMAVEMGWGAPLLVVIGVSWWLKNCLPLTLHPGESLRRAALVAFLLFVIHGFVDVAGHRIGSFLVGLLLAGLALNPADKQAASPWVAPIFRCIALLVGAIGVWWIASVYYSMGPPTTATLHQLQARVNQTEAQGRLASMGEAADAALEIAPLDWGLHFHRGIAEAFRTGSTDSAANDFQVSRFLEPNWIDLTANEGSIWLEAGQPGLCVDAWRDAIHRAGAKGPRLYGDVLRFSSNNPEVHRGLRENASNGIDYLITFLENATPEENKVELDALLLRDPNLQSFNLEQQKRLFSAWSAHGDRDDLAKALLEHTDWQMTGWPYLAQHFADQQDFEMATLTALKYIQAPALPPLTDSQTGPVLESNFNSHSDDTVAGILLFESQMQSNRVDDALGTLAKLEKLKDCPRYLFYFEAQLHFKKKEWEPAWNALQQWGGMEKT